MYPMKYQLAQVDLPNENIKLPPTPTPALPTARNAPVYYETPVCTSSRRRQRRSSKRPRMSITPLYCCTVCNMFCLNETDIKDDSENSVQCDKCRKWYHWGCVGYVGGDDEDDEWACISCNLTLT